jgi:hypothetical protein
MGTQKRLAAGEVHWYNYAVVKMSRDMHPSGAAVQDEHGQEPSDM